MDVDELPDGGELLGTTRDGVTIRTAPGPGLEGRPLAADEGGENLDRLLAALDDAGGQEPERAGVDRGQPTPERGGDTRKPRHQDAGRHEA